MSGSGNSYTAEFWQYDSRLGRRWNIDPVVKHYESPYASFANNPIWFVDPTGADTGDVVVAFGGGDIMGNKSVGETPPQIVKELQEQYLNQEGGVAKAFHSQYWGTDPEDKASLDKATQAAFDYILANFNKDSEGNDVEGGQILLYGYSYGGVMATHLADRLGGEGLTVNVLYTVDAAAGPETDEVDRTIGPNVRYNANFYQTTPSRVGSYGGANTATDRSKTKVAQARLQNVTHGDIDNNTVKAVIKSMLYNLNRPTPETK